MINTFKKQVLSFAILAGLGLGCMPEAKAELTTVQKVREGALYVSSTVGASMVAGIGALYAIGRTTNHEFGAFIGLLSGSALGYKLAQKLIHMTWNKRHYSKEDAAAITSSIEFLIIPSFVSAVMMGICDFD